jgi:acetoin utilization deacetylase AcuC-like enzyme
MSFGRIAQLQYVPAARILLIGGSMKIYYSDMHRQHDPPFEVVEGGQRTPYLENPARMDSILEALRETPWAEILEPADFGLEPIRAVQTDAYLEFLASAWREWLDTYSESSQPPADAAFLPATFALRRPTPHIPSSLLGRAGYYIMDLSAVIVAGTYEAALSSADCALSAAHAICDDNDREASAFALCRPPGHHAGADYAAGYCYINNAAVAAQWLAGRGKVALLDVDYHAANGTQEIFYERADLLTISLHADPSAEYPYYAGYADETGSGKGAGFHRNFPLPAGINDKGYLQALDGALEIIDRFAPQHLVVSVGMDICEHDPLGRFNITADGIHTIGERIAGLHIPTAVIMEGGYNTSELGRNVVAFLSAFAI